MATKKDQATDVTPKGEAPAATGTAVMSYKDRMTALVKQTQQAEKPAGGFISLKGGRMTYADEILPGDKIHAIIIDYRVDNELYLTKYDAKAAPRSPDCFVIARPLAPLEIAYKDDPEDADSVIPEPERPQGGSVKDEEWVPGNGCEGCWANEWGSDLGGGKGKACKTSRRIHLFAADECETVEDIKRAQYISMIPPATSVDNFQKFTNQTSKVLGSPIFGVKVEISVKPHDRFLFQVHFKILEQITDEELLMALLDRHEKISAKDITYPKNSERGDDADKARANRGSEKY